jgi:hypothetical protein
MTAAKSPRQSRTKHATHEPTVNRKHSATFRGSSEKCRLEGTDLKLLQFREQGIGHHDIYVLQRQPDRTTYQTPATRARDRIAALLQAKTTSDATATQLRAELAAVYASTSWRMTRPLRAIASVLRRR